METGKSAGREGEIEDIQFTARTGLPLATTVTLLNERLKSRGYGILSTIDVGKTIKEKTGRDTGEMMVLEVCNPAHALTAVQGGGPGMLLLPCRITVRGGEGGTVVSTVSPRMMIGMVGDRGLEEMAGKVEDDLRHIIEGIA
jgi:uncharacterized protein (DUF302 family)